MKTLVIIIMIIITVTWYIRPLYNFFAISKYKLLDGKDKSLRKRIQIGLPSLAFYTIIIGLMFYPVFTNNLINSFQSGSIILAEIIFIFLLTRYDKRQTKYQVTNKGIEYRRRVIRWDEKYSVKFKTNFIFFLHKPRFILKTNKAIIVVPLLSDNINNFVEKISKNNPNKGKYVQQIYHNSLNYFVSNKELSKDLKKV